MGRDRQAPCCGIARSTCLVLVFCFGSILLFLSMVMYRDYSEGGSINLTGEVFMSGSIANNTAPMRINTKTLLRNMAFELSTLRSNSKGQLDQLISAMEQTKEIVEKQAEQMQWQQESLKKQEMALEAHGKKVAQLKTGVALSHAIVQKERRLERFKLRAGHPNMWKQHSFVKHGTFGFLQYSSYRTAPSKFVTIGMAALRMRDDREFQGCVWHGNDGLSVEGDLQFLYSMEHHSMRYEPVILECVLKHATGANGGYLVGGIDDEEFVMIKEDEAQMEPPSTFQYQLTECSPPLFGELAGRAVWEWFEYHRVIVGVDHFVLYNVDAVDAEFMSYLKDYVDTEMVELIDFSDALSYNVWWWGQATAQHDCLYRSRHNSKWITMIDLDEFIDVRPPLTMGSILKKYEDVPWLTHGSVWWGIDVCNDKEGDDVWGLEKMPFHWPGHYCQDTQQYPDWRLCLDSAGHRKMIINPRKVSLMQIHRVLDPLEGGKHLNAEDEMVHNHFKQYNVKNPAKGKERCQKRFKDDQQHSWWIRDTHLIAMVERIKKCPISDHSCMERI